MGKKQMFLSLRDFSLGVLTILGVGTTEMPELIPYKENLKVETLIHMPV